jgi:hypothetical protein
VKLQVGELLALRDLVVHGFAEHIRSSFMRLDAGCGTAVAGNYRT